VYAFGNTNRTVGFARLNLPEVLALSDLYDELFTVPPGMPSAAFETLYKTEFGFKRACQSVAVGLRALQPKDLRVFMDGSKAPAYNASDAARALHFQTQETWIIAMLNNKDLNKRAEELAQALHQAGRSSRGKTTDIRRTEEVLASKSRREFIETLTAVLESDGSNGELFNGIVEEIMTMPTDNVPLFLTLVRFKHAYLSRKDSKSSTPSLPL